MKRNTFMGKLSILAFFTCLLLGCGVGGMKSSYAAVDHDPKLTAIAREAVPLLNALQAHKNQEGAYPSSLDSIASRLPKEGIEYTTDGDISRFNGWMYLWEPDGFRLYYALGWDPRFIYDSGQKEWTFDPGDGSPQKTVIIDLNSGL